MVSLVFLLLLCKTVLTISLVLSDELLELNDKLELNSELKLDDELVLDDDELVVVLPCHVKEEEVKGGCCVTTVGVFEVAPST